MTDKTGDTVRYHRADYHPGTDEPWLVWFTKDQADPYWFTAKQGEAMGLTPPPAQLVVECNGHSIEVPEWELDDFIAEWCEDGVEDYSAGSNRLATRFAYWLRDARQDPQPDSDPALLSPGEHLRGLLGDRDDAEQLLNGAKRFRPYDNSTLGAWLQVIGDAARGGAA